MSKNGSRRVGLTSIHGNNVRTIVQDVQLLLDKDDVLDLVIPIKNIRLLNVGLDLGLDLGSDQLAHVNLVTDMEAFFFNVGLEVRGHLWLL